MVEISSDIKIQIANLLKEHGETVAINIGCSILQEKTDIPKPACTRLVKALIKRFKS